MSYQCELQPKHFYVDLITYIKISFDHLTLDSSFSVSLRHLQFETLITSFKKLSPSRVAQCNKNHHFPIGLTRQFGMLIYKFTLLTPPIQPFTKSTDFTLAYLCWPNNKLPLLFCGFTMLWLRLNSYIFILFSLSGSFESVYSFYELSKILNILYPQPFCVLLLEF